MLGLWGLTLFSAAYLGVRIGRTRQQDGNCNSSIAVTSNAETEELHAPRWVPAAGNAPEISEIRQIIREELSRRFGDSPVAAAGASPAREPKDKTPVLPPLSPQLEANALESSRTIDHAISSRQWRPDDRNRFKDLTRDLPHPIVMELERKLNIAINLGTVTITDQAPPF